MNTLSDAELLTILAGPNAAGPPTRRPTSSGRCRPLPRESAGELARIAGVTPGDRSAVITAAVSAGTPRPTPSARPS